MKITTLDNQPIEVGAKRMFKKILDELIRSHRQTASNAIADAIKEHWARRFPNSDFYSPSCVYALGGNGEVLVDNPGVGRAYHDVDIYPVRSKYLAIPLVKFASKPVKFASKSEKLFKPKNKMVLAKSDSDSEGRSSLIAYYALSKHVHQNKDESIMPTERTIAESVFRAIWDEDVGRKRIIV